MRGFALRGDAKNLIVMGDGYEFMQIENWTRSAIAGVIYRRDTGRVGRFVATRKERGAEGDPPEFTRARNNETRQLDGQFSVYAPWSNAPIYFELNLNSHPQSSDDGNLLGMELGGALSVQQPDTEGGWYMGSTTTIRNPRTDPSTGVLAFDTDRGQTAFAVQRSGRLWLHLSSNEVDSYVRQNHLPLPFVRGDQSARALVDSETASQRRDARVGAILAQPDNRWIIGISRGELRPFTNNVPPRTDLPTLPAPPRLRERLTWPRP
jgi:hypothetical protein